MLDIRKKLDYYPKYDIDKIKEKIKNYEYVSFDIFDTLIKRDIHNNNDIYQIVEEKYYKNDKKAFYSDRINAEKQAREECKTNEISLNDIYKKILDYGKYTEKELEELKQIEIETEIEKCTKNIELYDIYNYCIGQKKKIIIISNMYLNHNIIEKILIRNGYNEFLKIFVSCDYDDRKELSLYKKVLDDLKINSNQLIHIGDSYRNDILGARKYNINTIKIPKCINKRIIKNRKQSNNANYNNLEQFINNRTDISNSYYYNFGYQVFGKILYGFNIWLKKEIQGQNIKNVYFLSRDGYIMKKCFDIYNNENIRTHYLEVSRRSTRVPMLWLNLSLETICKSFPAATLTSIEVFFDTIGLDINTYKNELKKLDIPLEYTFKKSEIQKNIKIKELYENIKQDIYDNSKKEYKLFIKYLEESITSNKIAIVDIGWRGSMQKFISTILEQENKNIDIIGYYMGLTDGAKIYKGEIVEYGYLFDCQNKEEKDPRGGYVGLFESLFLHNIGSVKKYNNDKNNKIVPIYYENEYYKDNVLNAGIKNILEIQEGAVAFVKDYHNNSNQSIENMNKEELLDDLQKVGTNPSMKELKMFSKIDFFDGEKSKLANPKALKHYIIHPKTLIKDFYNSRWKIGFLKKLFKIKLPYYNIYKFLKR